MNNSNSNFTEPSKDISKHFPDGQTFDLRIKATSPDNIRIDNEIEMTADCTSSVVSSVFLNFLNEEPKVARAIIRACDLYKKGFKSTEE